MLHGLYPCSYGALEASKAMSLTHKRSCRDTVSRRRTGSLKATSCLRPRFLSSQCGLWMRQCSRMVLATRSAA